MEVANHTPFLHTPYPIPPHHSLLQHPPPPMKECGGKGEGVVGWEGRGCGGKGGEEEGVVGGRGRECGSTSRNR